MDKIKKAPNLVGMVLCDPGRTEFKLFGGFFKDIGNHKKLDHDEFLC
ncbi:MAG: hypothetical protein QNK77_03270 [Crocinitomicaceae bacterium]